MVKGPTVHDGKKMASKADVSDEEEENLDVLDLPQLYMKPTAHALLYTLADLRIEPTSWDTTPGGLDSAAERGLPASKLRVRSDGLPDYLTRIISSRLGWIEGDGEKEQIWEAASQRLAERSGRTGMGAMSRSFKIPLDWSGSSDARPSLQGSSVADAPETSAREEKRLLELKLHEPALTEDNLGLKTWASSYLLARRLPFLKSTLPNIPAGPHILELGAGTGLVGLTAAAVFGAHVLLTDLPEIVPNLEANARGNTAVLCSHSGSVACAVLDWNEPGNPLRSGNEDTYAPRTFPLILAADPLYSSEHPRLLVQTIEYHLSRKQNARVVVELPLREAYLAERLDFKQRMTGIGLNIIDEGEEIGIDDWVDKHGDPAEVTCWWSVWKWHCS